VSPPGHFYRATQLRASRQALSPVSFRAAAAEGEAREESAAGGAVLPALRLAGRHDSSPCQLTKQDKAPLEISPYSA